MLLTDSGAILGSDSLKPTPADINQELDSILQSPMSARYGQSALAYGAEAKRLSDFGVQQIADKNLPEVTLHEGNDSISDAPPNAPVLDGAGRVQSIQYADGTTREYTYKDGQLASYKDRDGHTWAFTPPDEWKQQDGASVLHGEMIVEKDGSFTFINHDKNYVSHYGADGKEKVEARKAYSNYSDKEFMALQLAGKQFVATGMPQDSPEKHKQAATSATQPVLEPIKPEATVPVTKPETVPQPALEPTKPEAANKMPLGPEAIQAFARNFALDPAEVARVGSLTVDQVRAEMLQMPELERIGSKKYAFFKEMIFRLTDGVSSSAYDGSDLT